MKVAAKKNKQFNKLSKDKPNGDKPNREKPTKV